MTRLRVAVVMPPTTDLVHGAALDVWPTFTKALEALHAAGEIDAIGLCRTTSEAAMVERNGVEYHFEASDRMLAQRVVDLGCAVVHIHGLGFTRLMIAIRRAVGRSVPILMQHHGEPPVVALSSRIAQRLTRRMVDGYMFTGASGQAEPFRRAGVIGRSTPAYEVLESASDLDGGATAVAPKLGGSPCVLWVGRLIPSKDPLCAVRAIAAARGFGSAAELHILATDRSMEPEVRNAIGSSGLTEFVHVHQRVSHGDISGWYSRADVYLSTSHREGSNYSLIEALGFGCYPVVTDIPSHAAIVKELATRFAVGDADGAGVLLATPPVTRRDQIRDHARRDLSWVAVADQLTSAYRQSRRS